MSLLDSIKRALNGSTAKPAPKEMHVPEVTVAELLAELRNGAAPILLDCRESYERQQSYIPGSTHVVMREIPSHLNELDRDADFIVYCAHGNRSYGVAGYLIENGFRASSLRGGIVEWQMQGGEIER